MPVRKRVKIRECVSSAGELDPRARRKEERADACEEKGVWSG